MIPGATWPALETSTSTSPRSAVDRLRERVDRGLVGDVERVRDRLATRRPDLLDDLRALVDPPGTERDREAGPASACAVVAPMPEEAPVTTAGRRSGCAYLDT